ncbi:MAG: disulfide bond formation protein B [Pseudomonadota bacterium]
MTVYGRILLAGAGSALVLTAALGYQYLGGLAPCPMCIWQRWPHLVAVLLALLAVTVFWRGHKLLASAGALAMAAAAGLGLFHTGVERSWWQGPSTCTAAEPGSLNAAQLLDQILVTEVVRCDEVVWEFVGLSMASWNAVLSVGLAAIWLFAARAPLPELQRPT